MTFTLETEVHNPARAEYRTLGSVHVRHRILHAMRARGFPQNHLFPGPSGRHGALSGHPARRAKPNSRSCSPTATNSPSGEDATHAWADLGRPAPRNHPISSPWSRRTLWPLKDSFTTSSGRTVDLGIWVERGDETRCAHAMDALKNARWPGTSTPSASNMTSIFSTSPRVATSTPGAMENKGPQHLQHRLCAGECRNRDGRRFPERGARDRA